MRLVLLLLVVVAGCVPPPPGSINPDTCQVTAVVDCTNATDAFMKRPDPGECRVELDNGQRTNVARPVGVGDYVWCCPTGYTLWSRPFNPVSKCRPA